MKANRIMVIATVLVAAFAVSAVMAITASATELKPVWEVGKVAQKGVKGGRKLLGGGETRTTTVAGGVANVAFEYTGQTFEVICNKSSGTGTVIGGEPGTGKVSLTFAECSMVSGACKMSLLPLENIATKLVALKDEKTVTEVLEIAKAKAVSFLKVESPCGVSPGTYSLWGNLPGLVKEGETAEVLQFPATKLENYTLEWGASFHVTKFSDNLTQKLTSGEKLWVEI